MKRYLFASLLLHSLIPLWLAIKVKRQDGEPIEIEVLDVTPRKGRKGGGSIQPGEDNGDGPKADKALDTGAEMEGALEEYERSIEFPFQSKEYMYAAYYRRIGEATYGRWSTCVKDFLRTHKRIYAKQVTLLRIVLTKDGLVEAVIVVKSSGYPDLDQCGVDAFKSVKSFPNAPDEMVDADGKVRINWILSIN